MKSIVEMKDICKEFPGVKALSNVDLDIRAGEVHALVGENGAGKSAIIKTLMGVHQKTSGEIYFEGKAVEIKSPLHAQEIGLGAVYQDVNLAQHLSIAENFFMGQLPTNALGFVDYKRMYRETKEIMDSIEVNVNPRAIIKTLSVAEQEMVAIGKVSTSGFINTDKGHQIADDYCKMLRTKTPSVNQLCKKFIWRKSAKSCYFKMACCKQ